MPEHPAPKLHAHPWEERVAHGDSHGQPGGGQRDGPRAADGEARHHRDIPRFRRYVELAVTSNFSFLVGGSHPEEFVERAAALGYRAIAITDRHTLAGIVRAHVAAKERGIQLVVGSRLELLVDRDPDRAAIESLAGREPRRSGDMYCEVILYPTDLHSYGRLCRLLTIGKRRAAKGECRLVLHDLLDELLGHQRHRIGLLCTMVPPPVIDHAFVMLVEGLRDAYGPHARDCLSIAIHRIGSSDDALRSRQLVSLSEWTGVSLVAINDVHYHIPERRPLQDVLTCIRHGCSVQRAGYALFPNAERHLKPPEAMERLFADLPDAVARSAELAAMAAGFAMDQLRYRYPSEVSPPGVTPVQHLRALAWKGAAERYPVERFPRGVPDRVSRQIEHELALIADLRYEPFFLTVHDLVRFARSRDILCQGRGAAANSAVCYCLGITAVDPNRIDVLFERFVSKERNEPPDIDVDFEHERREEVIQYLYQTYGRDRAALAAEVISYRGRSAVRDVGKALGLSLDCVDRLASGIDWWHEGGVEIERVREIGLDPRDPTIRRLAHLTSELLGFPRHLSQHVGGFVITDGPLCELVPIENAAMADRTVIEWDKDDIDAMGMLKVDVLALGMLTCIRKTIDLVNADSAAQLAQTPLAQTPLTEIPLTETSVGQARIAGANRREAGPAPIQFHTIPPEDPAVYDMICAADTIGVFQIESRAQMSMLPRLRPRSFYDLVIEVAIVRPGPIQGDMVHPYLRRRNGEEPIVYPDEAVRQVLGKTLGVPLFQEQAMALAIVAAGFTPGEADQLRRAIGAWKRRGSRLSEFAAKLEQGMLERGYTQQFAQQVFRQIQGFSGYGFPESHAASFALLVYVSAWLKCHHPAAFAAALINSQPMGFYAPAQIVRDAREHGVEIRAVDANLSGWECALERIASDAMPRDFEQGATPGAGSLQAWEDEGPGPSMFRSPAPLLDRPVRINSRRQRELLRDPLMCLPSSRHSVAQDQPALRLGMRLVRGLRGDEAERIVDAVRRAGPFGTIRDLWRASGVGVPSLRRLAAADAFRSMGLDRQRALWQIRALRDEPAPLFERPQGSRDARDRTAPTAPTVPFGGQQAAPPAVPRSPLPPVLPIAAVAHDYTAVGLSLKRHPAACIRERLAARGAVPCAVLRDPTLTPQGTSLAVAGVVLVRQRPATAKGILFMTVEDESGIANLILRPKVYERFRRAARQSVMLMATGTVERRDDVVHLLVRRVIDVSGDSAIITTTEAGDQTTATIEVAARNFH